MVSAKSEVERLCLYRWNVLRVVVARGANEGGPE